MFSYVPEFTVPCKKTRFFASLWSKVRVVRECTSYLYQGRLKIWTEHSTLILLNSKPFEIALQKFQHFYKLERNNLAPNLEGVAQTMGLPRPFELLDIFGRKVKSKAPRAFKFSTKWVPIEVNNWWKFGVDISNHLWDIQNWKFFFLKVPPTRYKNSFWKFEGSRCFRFGFPAKSF